MSSLLIAMGQMQSTDDIQINKVQILKMLSEIPEGVHLLCLPENCLYFRISKDQTLTSVAIDDPILLELQSGVDAKNCALILGSVALKEAQAITNAMVLLAPGAKPQVIYRKIHLFDVDVDGEAPQRESQTFASGSEPQILNYLGLRWGLSICYDLRFAELYSHYARAACDVILVPSAFLVTTGRAHWHTLLKARAIESQCFIVAPAQSGTHKNAAGATRSTYGHSLAVDPWGLVVAEGLSEGPKNILVPLDLSRILRARAAIPMAHHRKL